jgi:hypothetical protein
MRGLESKDFRRRYYLPSRLINPELNGSLSSMGVRVSNSQSNCEEFRSPKDWKYIDTFPGNESTFFHFLTDKKSGGLIKK